MESTNVEVYEFVWTCPKCKKTNFTENEDFDDGSKDEKCDICKETIELHLP